MVRPYAPGDYKSVSQMWAAQDYPIIPEVLLPKVGSVAFDATHKPLAAVWLVQATDIPLGMLAWTVGNRNADKLDRHQALRAAVTQVICQAKDLGIKYVKAVVENPSLKDHYLATGAKLADENICQVGWAI